MAINRQTFITRTITGAVFITLMLIGLLWNKWSFFILFSIIHFGCWIEYQKLMGLIDKDYQQVTPFHKYGVRLAGWCIMLYFTSDAYNIFAGPDEPIGRGLRLHELGWWIGLILVFILPIGELLFSKQIQLKNIGYSILGLLYISGSWGLMMDLYNRIDIHVHDTIYVCSDHFIPVAIVASIWVNDTMAYLIGSLIGKTSLSKISPKKTWEGTIGGIITSLGIVWLSGFYIFHNGYLTYYLLIITGIASITGTFGDLLQSKLKRMANVKDSGNLMPGHGGFLDRFDSLLLATPLVWLYVRLFIR
jgi:phosphatidate cytidylyltransferase